MIIKPQPGEYGAFYQKYIDRIGETDIIGVLKKNLTTTRNLVENLSEEKLLYRYADGKWSIKEILVHLIDAERVFSYRAMRIARGDKTPLPGFEENDYAPQSFADRRTITSILEEFGAVRNATVELFANLDTSVHDRTGTASNSPISVRASAFIIAGHEIHHQNVIRDKYLK